MPKPKPKPKAKPKLKAIPLLKQPPFDTSITNLPHVLGQVNNFQRGIMRWDTTQPFPAGYGDAKKGQQPATVNFLFNPSTISTSYQIADGSAQAALNYGNTSVSAALLLPMQQQTSFTIMFDRTYELNNSKTLQKYPEITNYGCDVDVAALRQYTGMYAAAYAGNANYFGYNPSNEVQQGQGTSVASANQNNKPLSGGLDQGIMQLTLGYVFFGHPGTSIQYYGYIDSWSVEYTHFTVHMIPLRCVVDVSFTFLPPPLISNQTKANAGAQKASLGQLFGNVQRIAGNGSARINGTLGGSGTNGR